MGPRIGADVGGTFTDIVLERRDGSYVSTKVLTTHDAPEIGILDGIERIVAREGVSLTDVTQIIHGTTLATNALIERRGARTALVTTDGFRDVIETRTESRFEQYDLDIVLPRPLIERRDRFTVTERLNARGETLVSFDDDEARAVIEALAAGGYESVAVGFIHAYRNAAHERRFRELLVAELPEGDSEHAPGPHTLRHPPDQPTTTTLRSDVVHHPEAGDQIERLRAESLRQVAVTEVTPHEAPALPHTSSGAGQEFRAGVDSHTAVGRPSMVGGAQREAPVAAPHV